MRERWQRNVVPIGSREWVERQRTGQEPDWLSLLPEATKPEFTWKPTTPDAVREHMREIGRQGGLQRSRNYARRNFHKGIRFWQRYGSNPNDVRAAPVSASPDVSPWLKEFASRGGQARARKCSPEQLNAIAAKGGHAKAAKRRQASSPAQSVAGKQE
jgi:general stress protein YciG